jgi:hypothetical protein
LKIHFHLHKIYKLQKLLVHFESYDKRKNKMTKANLPCIPQRGFETKFTLLNWYNVPCNESLMNIETWFNIKYTMENVSWPRHYFSDKFEMRHSLLSNLTRVSMHEQCGPQNKSTWKHVMFFVVVQCSFWLVKKHTPQNMNLEP